MPPVEGGFWDSHGHTLAAEPGSDDEGQRGRSVRLRRTGEDGAGRYRREVDAAVSFWQASRKP